MEYIATNLREGFRGCLKSPPIILRAHVRGNASEWQLVVGHSHNLLDATPFQRLLDAVPTPYDKSYGSTGENSMNRVGDSVTKIRGSFIVWRMENANRFFF